MNRRERELIGRLFESLSRLSPSQQVYEELLDSVRTYAEAGTANLIDHSELLQRKRLVQLTVSDDPGHARDFSRLHESYFIKNPMNSLVEPVSAQRAPVHTIRLTEVVGEHTWHESEFYRDFCRNMQFENPVGLVIKDRRLWPRLGIGLGMSSRSRRCPGSKLAFLDWMLPHIRQALLNMEQWRDRLTLGEAWKGLASSSQDPIAAIARSPSGTPYLVAASGSASRILRLDQAPNRSLHLQDFLNLGCRAVGANAERLEWQASDGKTYLLAGIKSVSSGMPDVVYLRIIECHSIQSAKTERAHALRLGLTEREADVVALMAAGRSNKEMARDLRISYDTARAHVRNIFSKLGVSSRMEAVYAIRDK